MCNFFSFKFSLYFPLHNHFSFDIHIHFILKLMFLSYKEPKPILKIKFRYSQDKLTIRFSLADNYRIIWRSFCAKMMKHLSCREKVKSERVVTSGAQWSAFRMSDISWRHASLLEVFISRMTSRDFARRFYSPSSDTFYTSRRGIVCHSGYYRGGIPLNGEEKISFRKDNDARRSFSLD